MAAIAVALAAMWAFHGGVSMLGGKSSSPMKRDRVPEKLRKFIPYVQKWGAVTSDAERYELEDNARADPEKLEELKRFAADYHGEHQDALNEWTDREPITQCYEASKFYFAILLLDELDLLRLPYEDTVDSRIRDLQRHGSVRLASGRMFAAQFVVDHGEEAKRAIPVLRRALADEDDRVRVWAHYALWALEGRDPRHIDEIAKALESRHEEAPMEAAAALQKIGPHAERAVPALIATIDRGEISRLVIAALAAVGAKNKRAQETLKALAESSKDEWIRQEAAEALEVIQGR